MRCFLEKCFSVFARYVRSLLLHPVDLGVQALVEQDGRVVLVRHSYKSGWLLPGGAVERNEHPAVAILRELREEIGLTSSATPQLLHTYVRWGVWASNLVLVYRVEQAVFDFKPSWEILAYRLVDPHNLPEDTFLSIRRRLEEIYCRPEITPT